ncbi:MAG: NADPH-dependent 7-cyano-7-deazaguanine reductase QueF, partial [Dokdonella sp.]
MNTADQSPLGKATDFRADAAYDPRLLFAIPRAAKRVEIGIGAALPFHGADLWNAYELSWLDARGKPQVALAEFRFPAESPNLIESKSFKLFLNSCNQSRFESVDAVCARLGADLAVASGSTVAVQLIRPDRFAQLAMAPLVGDSIDGLDISIDHYQPPQPDFLDVDRSRDTVEETLTSDLLKSNCPVTGQPDWASVQIRYVGAPIDRAGLLRYLVSYRLHDDFHEQCVERIFVDISRRCAPA